MAKKQKIKKETWLVFYRTKTGAPGSMEVDGNLTREEAIDYVVRKKKLTDAPCSGFAYLETGIDGPIVKRLCYV